MILAEIRPYPIDLPRDGESRKWHLQLATLEILEAWHHDLAWALGMGSPFKNEEVVG